MLIWSRIRIRDYFYTFLTIVDQGSLGDFFAFLIVTGQFLRHFGEITDTDKIVNPDIQVGIWINPEIQIHILDHLWFRLDALAEVCTL